MASSAKSKKLGLSLWEATDKPERMDFRGDNEALENLVGGHIGDTVKHLEAAEKQFVKKPFYTLTYTGTGTASAGRNYTELSKVKMAFAMALGHAPVEYDENGKAHVYWDVCVNNTYSTATDIPSVRGGIVISESMPNRVYAKNATLSDGTVLCMNEKSTTYLMILIQDAG